MTKHCHRFFPVLLLWLYFNSSSRTSPTGQVHFQACMHSAQCCCQPDLSRTLFAQLTTQKGPSYGEKQNQAVWAGRTLRVLTQRVLKDSSLLSSEETCPVAYNVHFSLCTNPWPLLFPGQEASQAPFPRRPPVLWSCPERKLFPGLSLEAGASGFAELIWRRTRLIKCQHCPGVHRGEVGKNVIEFRIIVRKCLYLHT